MEPHESLFSVLVLMDFTQTSGTSSPAVQFCEPAVRKLFPASSVAPPESCGLHGEEQSSSRSSHHTAPNDPFQLIQTRPLLPELRSGPGDTFSSKTKKEHCYLTSPS